MSERAATDLSRLESRWQEANAHATSGEPAAALEIYLSLVDDLGNVAALWCNMSSVYTNLEQFDEALAALLKAVETDPLDTDSLAMLGQLQSSLGEFPDAAETLRKATEIDPQSIELRLSFSRSLFQAGHDDEGEKVAEEALSMAPDNPDLLFLLGGQYLENKRFDEAAELLQRAYSILPHPMIANNLSEAFTELESREEAINLLEEAVINWPEEMKLWNQLGAIKLDEGLWMEAKSAFLRALEIEPDAILVKQNLARCLLTIGSAREATAMLEELLPIHPDRHKLFSDLALAAATTGDWIGMETFIRRALEERPNEADNWVNLAQSLVGQVRRAEAIEAANHALKLDPDNAAAYVLMAASASSDEETRDYLEKALTKLDDELNLLLRIAFGFESIKDSAEAIRLYKRALELEPGQPQARSRLFDLNLSICDWRDYDILCQDLIDEISAAMESEDSTSDVDVFNLQAMPVSYAFTAKAAKAASVKIAQRVRKQADYSPFRYRAAGSKKIRIGYALAYTHVHSLPLVHKQLVEAHDRDRFEIYGYSINPCDRKEFSTKYRRCFDKFSDLSPLAPHDSASRIHQDNIDILVDVTGLTGQNCMSISSFRPAPVQVHAYGYSITTGADYIDYLITDRTYIPPEWEALGSEKLVYLPGSFMPACEPPHIGAPTTRTDNGLPEDAIVFCNFNHPCKFEPTIFAAWMEIMRAVPDSVMWFGSWLDGTRENLRAQAELQGVAPDRLIFSEVVLHADHLARLVNADIALDNLHHGGGVTSLDALWSGVPLLSILGQTPAARLGASLLNGFGMPELILPNLDAFKRTAIELAHDHDKRQALHERVLHQRQESRLFDIQRHTRKLEAGFEEMWANYLAGNGPKRIEVA